MVERNNHKGKRPWSFITEAYRISQQRRKALQAVRKTTEDIYTALRDRTGIAADILFNPNVPMEFLIPLSPYQFIDFGITGITIAGVMGPSEVASLVINPDRDKNDRRVFRYTLYTSTEADRNAKVDIKKGTLLRRATRINSLIDPLLALPDESFLPPLEWTRPYNDKAISLPPLRSLSSSYVSPQDAIAYRECAEQISYSGTAPLGETLLEPSEGINARSLIQPDTLPDWLSKD